MSALTFENVSVKNILHDISFTVETGGITALIGKNGSGKTTALRAAAGDVRYSGKITVKDKDISLFAPKERARLVSLMPQMLPSPHITVEELVRLGRFPYTGGYGTLSENDLKAVTRSLELAGISHMRRSLVDEISGGERQSAFLALLLAQDTPVVMLDEPTAHLDIGKRRKLHEIMRTMADSGKAVLCVMHDINDALDLGDKIILLDKGELVFSGTPTAFHSGEYAKDIFALEKCTLTKNGEDLTYYI